MRVLATSVFLPIGARGYHDPTAIEPGGRITLKIWINGSLQDAADTGIAASDRGLLLGDGIYETLLVRGGEPCRLGAHLDRLRHGAGVLRLALPSHDLAGAMRATLAANGITDGSLRLTLTRGSGPRGIAPPDPAQPTLLLTANPAAAPLPPARCILARGTRRNEHSPLAGIKSINCLDAILARIEAREREADEAILLNTAGRVAEATASNLFALIDGRLVTPPLGEGVLPGVMRAEVLAAGAIEAPVATVDLRRAAEVFLTSSLGIRSARSLDGQEFESDTAAAALRRRLGFSPA